jgi:hypothetical protein
MKNKVYHFLPVFLVVVFLSGCSLSSTAEPTEVQASPTPETVDEATATPSSVPDTKTPLPPTVTATETFTVVPPSATPTETLTPTEIPSDTPTSTATEESA